MAATGTQAPPPVRTSSKQDLKRLQQEEEQRVKEEQRRQADEIKKAQQLAKKAVGTLRQVVALLLFSSACSALVLHLQVGLPLRYAVLARLYWLGYTHVCLLMLPFPRYQ